MKKYYVAKLYSSLNPSIVESFDDVELAEQFASVLNKAGKGTYIVLSTL